MKGFIFISLLLFSVAATAAQDQKPTPNVRLSPADCSWEAPVSSSGRGRRAMKTRTPRDTRSYKAYNRGRAIDLTEWFRFTCSLNSLVPDQPAGDTPIEGAEDVTVTLKGYVLAVKFMRGGDRDMHVELGETPDWNGDHIVVEMSPGKEYCKARAALWKIVEKDGCKEDECILKKPVKVRVKGDMMSGGAPAGTTDYCHVLSPRGLKDASHESRVRGVWRLQPVFTLSKAR